MKIFFQADKKGSKELKEINQLIIEILQENGVDYYTNLKPERIENENIFMFDQINAVVIEDSSLKNEANYILALALSQKKPILYLVRKGSVLKEEIRELTNNKKLSAYFKLKYYCNENLKSVVSKFIDLIGAGDARKELATVKFTLRMTPKMERYLTWKVNNTKMKKADYLRILLNEIIESDQDYTEFLKKEE